MIVLATYLGFPFDPELFDLNWRNEPDPTKTAILDSGAMISDAEIQRLISNGSDYYTIPFYKLIGGDPVNYDGSTDIPATEAGASSQSGIVYGRAKAWTARDFVFDYNSGADPMRQITSQVSRYWSREKQKRMIKILDAIFGINGTGEFAGWNKHSKTLAAAAGGTVTEENLIGETTVNDTIVDAVGDNADIFSLAIMHSQVANRLAKLQLLSFRKYTDSKGIERTLRIADINGMAALVDDDVPAAESPVSGAKEYTTYLLGRGALLTAAAPVKQPSEVARDPARNGGQDTLYTRIRETIHPNGFSFKKPSSGYTSSPKDEQLANKANWAIVGNPKNIPIARVITNG